MTRSVSKLLTTSVNKAGKPPYLNQDWSHLLWGGFPAPKPQPKNPTDNPVARKGNQAREMPLSNEASDKRPDVKNAMKEGGMCAHTVSPWHWTS